MAGAPDLFVVCKNCQAEVSPYITECPYCGHRLRKRAPKLEKGAVPRVPKPPRRPPLPRLPSRRTAAARDDDGGLPGRPYVPLFLVVAAVLVSLAVRTTLLDPLDVVVGPSDDIWLRALVAPFVYLSTAYEVVALAAIFLFGWLLHRRHGPIAPLLVFVSAGSGGMLIADGMDPGTLATGGNGAALGLLAAWAMRDVFERRRGEDVDSDGVGLAVAAVVLIALPAAVEEAGALAGAAGGVIGVVWGLLFARMAR